MSKALTHLNTRFGKFLAYKNGLSSYFIPTTCYSAILVFIILLFITHYMHTEFMQSDLLHLPDVGEHLKLCFLHVYLMLQQSVQQLHLITHRNSSGAGGKLVCTGISPAHLSFQPMHSSNRKSSREPFHICTCKYTYRLWYFAAAEKPCG